MLRRGLPIYYASRALLVGVIGYLAVERGHSWWVVSLLCLAAFVMFLRYVHSGSHVVDMSNRLFPIRRDARGRQIRDRAVVFAVVTGSAAYALAGLGLTIPAVSPPAVAVATYFVVSTWMFARV
jgi:hypothetical protein